MNESSPMHQMGEELWEVNQPLANEISKGTVAT